MFGGEIGQRFGGRGWDSFGRGVYFASKFIGMRDCYC